jgi:hypothetical protein
MGMIGRFASRPVAAGVRVGCGRAAGGGRVLRGLGAVVAVAVGVLGGGVASALAVEEPTGVGVGLLGPSSVSLVGTVSPVVAPGVPGLYWFAYRAGSGCKGGSRTTPVEYLGLEPGERAEEPALSAL